MKKKATRAEPNVIPSFIEGQDSDDHYNVVGDLKVNAIVDCQASIHCCRFNPSGEIFAVGLSNGAIKLYYTKNSNEPIYILLDDDIRNSRLPATSIRFFNPPNDLNLDHYKIIIAGYVTGFVKFWHYPSKACIFTIKDRIEPLTIDLNLSFDKLAVGGYSSYINVYDVSTKKLINTMESNGIGSSINGHSSRVYCVKYNPSESNQLFSGGWDDTIQIWDDRISQSQNYIYGPHVCGESIDIDTKYNHLLTGSWRKSSPMQIWDLRNCEQIRDVFKNKATMMIYGCQWLANSCIFTGGSEKNAAIIYDRGTLQPVGGLFELKNAVTSIDNDRNGDFSNLLVASSNLLFILKRKW